ncbi:MAG TPA: phosphoribosylaminoimidazolesuccinocarboxamide synthase [Rhodothermales bacterium]|nr:phosphoribosylaminoimidazolesuccinocarboxamide synthase [Rhodothermales bacterium]
MTSDLLSAALPRALARTDLPGLGTPYRGKVRDVYALPERLVIVTTDRISAFDHVFDEAIPYKGQVLNRLAAHFFELTADVMPNHVLAVPHGAVTIAQRCEAVPVEFVVRGYLAGHALRTYESGQRTLCGQMLPEGLKPYDPLPEPILTPATKAAAGHDEDITPAEIVRRGVLTSPELARLTEYALALYRRGSALAATRGLLLLDTKFEFGRTPDGDVLVIDEILTPDSSRYVHADDYAARVAADEPPRHLSKELLREWLLARGFRGDGPPPALPDDIRVAVAQRYIELFETLTGTPFEPDDRDLSIAITA